MRLFVAALFALTAGEAAFGQTGCAAGRQEAASVEIEFVAGRTAVVWHPAGLRDCGRLPVVVFSHGFNGCATQTRFFTEELARRGYLVVAPNHVDATCGGKEPNEPEQSYAEPEKWSEQTYLSRRDDLREVLDSVLNHPVFGPHMDVLRIGGAGHSLGGYSLMASAGAWPSWTDPRYRAILLFSPYSTPFLEQGTVAQIRVPVMYQGGTLDLGITPFLKKEGGVYDATNPAKYYVELQRAAHFAWTNATCQDYSSAQQCAAEDRTARLINQYGLAFLDQHLKGVPQPLLTAPRHPQLADYRFARE